MELGWSLVPEELFVRPCVNGTSNNPNFFFNFSLLSRCTTRENCSLVTQQPEANFISPILKSLTGIIGNITALIFLYCATSQSKHRTVFYVLLATLIWTDLVGQIITTPVPLTAYANGHFVGGMKICKMHGFSMSLIALVTHLLVAIMAVERFIGIRHGYFYQDYVTIFRTRMLLLGIWLFCLTFCSLPLIGMGQFKLHLPGTWCHVNQHVCDDHPWQDKAFAYFYSSVNMTCLILMVVCNLVVVGTLLKMRVTKFRPSRQCRQMPSKKGREFEIQMVLVLLIITVVFVTSWAAHDLLMVKNRFWPPPPFINPWLDFKAIRLVSFSQISDPWAYIICQVIFKSRMWKYFRYFLIGTVATIRRDSKGSRLGSRMSSTTENRKKSFSKDDSAEVDIHNGCVTPMKTEDNNFSKEHKSAWIGLLYSFLCFKSPHKGRSEEYRWKDVDTLSTFEHQMPANGVENKAARACGNELPLLQISDLGSKPEQLKKSKSWSVPIPSPMHFSAMHSVSLLGIDKYAKASELG